MTFDCESTFPRKVHITAHAHERMRAEDRNFTEAEVIEAVKRGRWFPRGRLHYAVLGNVTALIVSEGNIDTVITVITTKK